MKRYVCGVLLVSAVCLAADAPRSIPMDGYAALVNDRVITVGDVIYALGPIEERLARIENPEEAEAQLRRLFEEALEMLIERALILEEFKRREREIPERIIEGEAEGAIREHFDGNRAAFLQALASERMTYDDWRNRLRESVMLMALRHEALGEPLPVSPRAVQNEYEARRDEFRKLEEVKISMILLHRGSTPETERAKRSQAEALRQRILEGEAFASLARSVSEGPRADRGGDMGWMRLEDLRPVLREAVAGMQPGDLSGVLAEGDAFYLIRLEGRKQGGVTPLEEVRGEIEQRLIQQREEARYREWIERLRQRHHVRVF